MANERMGRPRDHLRFFRTAAAHRRSVAADFVLALALAFVAGGINAGGFLAIGQYTSHMTGILSAVSDNVALGQSRLVGAGVVAVLSFTTGAAVSAILINWGRRNARTRQYAYPLAIEAVLLLGFGVIGGASRQTPEFLSIAPPLLCFIMGLQNATITKLSGSRMRTTHVTGIVTDIGIELGKLAYWHRDHRKSEALRVTADIRKLGMLSSILGMFVLGGITGALGFGHIGYSFSVPLALLLLGISVPQLTSAWRLQRRRARGPDSPPL